MRSYFEAGNRIHQSITALVSLEADYTPLQAKHLRVGIDLSQSDISAIAQLLIAKGVFTEAEYIEAITTSANDLARSYEIVVQAVFSE